MALLRRFRSKGLAGATLMQAVAGFGRSLTLHEFSALNPWTASPIVIEVIDTEERIASVLPEVDEMMAAGGIITLEPVRVVRYADRHIRQRRR
jgi:PII-like signaling protein